MDHLIKPHGGTLVNLLADDERVAQLKAESQGLVSVTLSQRQLCDLELLMNGALSPLAGFMTEPVYDRVLQEMRLPGGLLWPMPVTLDIPEALAVKLEQGARQIGVEHHAVNLSAGIRVDGAWYVQNSNAYHSRLKGWIYKFRGVATRYPANYLGCFRALDREHGNGPKPAQCLAMALGGAA